MPIELTTGVPGAGKTLFTVAEVLRPLVGATIEVAGRQVERRLMIGGIPDLLLPHDLVEVPVVNPEDYKDEWSAIERRPGEAPVRWYSRQEGTGRLQAVELLDGQDVPAGVFRLPVRADNWWLWAQPGDVIVVDECQRLFRPMAAGRKIPQFIARLETHRHYGVDFVIVTQHPQLLHTNVRNLVGKHRHVRRMFGGGMTLVYEWDHVSNPDRLKAATSRPWKHKRAAFGLYKSAEVHTKQRATLGLPLIITAIALLLLPVLWWNAFHKRGSAEVVAAASEASASASAVGGARPLDHPTVTRAVGEKDAGPWPVLNVSAAVTDREPFADRAIHLQGSYAQDGRTVWLFLVSMAGRPMVTVTDRQLLAAGYRFSLVAPCAGVLEYRGRERAITCDTPAAPAGVAPVPAPGASANERGAAQGAA